jgi:H+/Cl- antiporter ClcA/CBS domain-containing protein
MPEPTPSRPMRPVHLGDFTLTPRVLLIMALAVPVGAVSAGAAWTLLRLIGLVTNAVFWHRVSTTVNSPGAARAGWWIVLGAPVIGGLVVGLMARFGSERIRGHGMPEAIEAILMKGSRVQPRVAALKPISAAIIIGTGGPFGAEGPIIMTGGALGSILAQVLKLSADERKSLMVAGAAGGMAATFNAPLASVLLAVELLLFEWRPRSFLPVSAAVIVSTLLRGPLLGHAAVFPLDPTRLHIDATATILCAPVGVVGGLLAVAVTALVYFSEDAFAKLPIHWMWWPALGGVIIGIGGLIEPRALGVGYDVIRDLLTGHAGMSLILGILVVKSLMWGLSLGSGTSGGVLAPVFMIGAALGALEGHVLPDAGPGFWALAGLSSVVGGMMRSPFTGVIFPLELTHAWSDTMPLLVTASSAYCVSALLLKRSVLTEKVARRGFHLSREYDVDPLEVLFVREVMHSTPATLRAEHFPPTAAVLAATVPRPGHADGMIEPLQRLFPVLDAGGGLCGVVTRRSLTDGLPGQVLSEVLITTPLVVHADDTLRAVAGQFAEHSLAAAPVVDRAEPTRLLGMVTVEALLDGRLRDLAEAHHRERAIRPPVLVAARRVLSRTR